MHLPISNYQLAHINKNIDVDGVLNEPHWQQATHVAVNYQDEPNEKGTPPVKQMHTFMTMVIIYMWRL